MKILYNQKTATNSILANYGIHNCIVRLLHYKQDSAYISKLAHHHTSFELHVVIEGAATYEIENNLYRIEAGELLFLPPYVQHRFLESEVHTIKYSASFQFSPDCNNETFLQSLKKPIRTPSTKELLSALTFIHTESEHNKSLSDLLISNRILECVYIHFRLLGFRETDAEITAAPYDVRLQIIKQFISENIEQNLTVEDLAAYCHLSSKQLTRLFKQEENKTPLAYLKEQRMAHIKKLLTDKSLSFREISEIMHFSSEYYFHTFFKKEEGMPPGAYRKMIP